MVAYCDSRLANEHYRFGLGERLTERGLGSEITVVRLQPGFAGSDFYANWPWIFKTLVLTFLAGSPKSLSCNEVRCAVDESFTTGTYTNPARMKRWGAPVVGEPTAYSKDKEQCDKLWNKTEKLVGEPFFPQAN
mmetsp:Transcript_21698/g.48926  ORF Transcript_21698/g.48926 Transcript_21698/m.48926 type:complete len:134 (+) Transcript_21698:322-723(+)